MGQCGTISNKHRGRLSCTALYSLSCTALYSLSCTALYSISNRLLYSICIPLHTFTNTEAASAVQRCTASRIGYYTASVYRCTRSPKFEHLALIDN